MLLTNNSKTKAGYVADKKKQDKCWISFWLTNNGKTKAGHVADKQQQDKSWTCC
jgi:hypothetical protein